MSPHSLLAVLSSSALVPFCPEVFVFTGGVGKKNVALPFFNRGDLQPSAVGKAVASSHSSDICPCVAARHQTQPSGSSFC